MTRLPEAVALLGFAFYLHPCLIPVLREMPAGRIGLRATISATRIVLYGKLLTRTPLYLYSPPLPQSTNIDTSLLRSHCLKRALIGVRLLPCCS